MTCLGTSNKKSDAQKKMPCLFDTRCGFIVINHLGSVTPIIHKFLIKGS